MWKSPKVHNLIHSCDLKVSFKAILYYFINACYFINKWIHLIHTAYLFLWKLTNRNPLTTQRRVSSFARGKILATLISISVIFRNRREANSPKHWPMESHFGRTATRISSALSSCIKLYFCRWRKPLTYFCRTIAAFSELYGNQITSMNISESRWLIPKSQSNPNTSTSCSIFLSFLALVLVERHNWL